MICHKGQMKTWGKPCFSFPQKKKFNKTFNDNPASFTLTSYDGLGSFKLQFVFCAGKANAKSYTLSTGPNCTHFLKADTDSHSKHEQFV